VKKGRATRGGSRSIELAQQCDESPMQLHLLHTQVRARNTAGPTALPKLGASATIARDH